MSDFVFTIDSDDEDFAESSRQAQSKAEDLDPDFTFDPNSNGFDGAEEIVEQDELIGAGPGKNHVSVDDIISKRLGEPLLAYREKKRKRQEQNGGDESASEASEQENEEDGAAEDDSEDMEADEHDDEEDDLKDEESQSASDEPSENAESDEDASEASDPDNERKAAFFDKDDTVDPTIPSTFAAMNLSRPLLRALTSLSLTTPTPIQARAIPLALQGRDLLGSAVTGSGKTAAFIVPILERLCYRDRSKGGQACRVLVLCPTRELAVQCEAVGRGLVEKAGLDIRFALLVGGLSLNAQAHTLRTLPDILIATPGRLIDHLTNTPAFTLSALDVLVIDEADRMLEQGFSDELSEIVKACPKSRQTMLFSATMTDSVDELVRLSLNKPIRVFIDPQRSTAAGLTQEFVRIRSDDTRSPVLLALCQRTVRDRCIIFFRSKALAHQMKVLFGLCGLKAAELHGNLSQEQRLNALTDFKAGKVDYLLATDLASRGLDIKGVETVINYDMPGQLASYTHRVGRTARAGRKGRSISLVGEADRKMLKTVIKYAKEDQIRHRIVPADAVTKSSAKIAGIQDDITEILQEEREERLLRQADMEATKGQNMVKHEAEIFARPARTWFQSEKEKKMAKDTGKSDYLSSFPSKPEVSKPSVKRGKFDGLSRKVKRRKMILEEDSKENDASIAASVRSAKKNARPKKITEYDPPEASKKKSKKLAVGGVAKQKKVSTVGAPKGKRSAFDSERGTKKQAAAAGGRHEGMRAKPVKVNLSKQGKQGRGGGSKKRR